MDLHGDANEKEERRESFHLPVPKMLESKKLFNCHRKRDERVGGVYVGFLVEAVYGTRDAPLIWRAAIDGIMIDLGFHSSVLQPEIYFHAQRSLLLMVYVDFSPLELRAN